MVANYTLCLLLAHPAINYIACGYVHIIVQGGFFLTSTFHSLYVQYIDLTSITLMGISVISVLFLSQDMLRLKNPQKLHTCHISRVYSHGCKTKSHKWNYWLFLYHLTLL